MNPPTKPHAALERWIWVLIYGGLLLLVFGIAVGRAQGEAGWALGVSGAVLAIAGFLLIYVRSRFKD